MMFVRRRQTMCFANGMLSSIKLSYAFLLCFSYFCSARDTITEGDPLRDDGSEGLVSAGGIFELGFFSLNGTGSSGSYRRYVGIWYHQSDQTPTTFVWVANRDKPLLPNHTGLLAINRGTLRLSDLTSNKTLWSAEINIPVTRALNRTVKLKDDGNLVLSDTELTPPDLWQSFQNPTDTFIPGMKMEGSLTLTSWNGVDDPGNGSFTFKLDEDNQYVVKKSSTIYWRSEAPNANVFSSDEMPTAVAYLLSNFSKSYSTDVSSTNFGRNGSRYKQVPYNQIAVLKRSEYNSTRLVIDYTGKLKWFVYKHYYWSSTWQEPRDNCSVFNPCGKSGTSCNSNRNPNPICQCLQGFTPQFQQIWASGNFSGGCIREFNLCTQNNNSTARNDTFFSLKVKKVQKPDSRTSVANETECRNKCFNECTCVAYSYVDNGSRNHRNRINITRLFFTWAELSNLEEEEEEEEEDSGGHNLHVRIAVPDCLI